jgi:hypothetical protein
MPIGWHTAFRRDGILARVAGAVAWRRFKSKKGVSMKKLLTGFCLLFLIVFAASSPSNAQGAPADETYVSGLGTDFNGNTNNCEVYQTPCATFQNAYIHTNPGGTINCSSGWNFTNVTLTIAQSITIDCLGATFTLDASGVDYITVNAGPNDDVTIRGIQFVTNLDRGGRAGLTGVKFISGHSLHIENCTFNGLITAGVSIMPTTVSSVFIADSKFRTNASGVLIKPSTGGSVAASFLRVAITSNTGGGIKTDSADGIVNLDITDSEISYNNGIGINARSGGSLNMVSIKNSIITKNGAQGVQANGANVGVTVQTTLFNQNASGATSVVAGGHISTYGNNSIVGSSGSGFTGTASLQ